MTITVQKCSDYLEHELYGGLPKGLDVLSLVNLAGESLANAHPWRWLVGASTTLDFVGGQSYVELPSDFRAVVSVDNTAGLTSSMTETSITDILAQRTNSIIEGNWNYSYAVVQHRATGGGAPLPRLELYPTPTSDLAGALTLFYRAGWQTVDEDSDSLTLPFYCELLVLEVLAAVAHGVENREGGTPTLRLEEIWRGTTFLHAQQVDVQQQPTQGRVRSGAVRQAGMSSPYRFNFDPVPGPG